MDDAPPPSAATLLVVDDTPDSLRFLMTALEAARMTVLVAIDGFAALDLLQHITPDLILMDVVMPGQSGFQLTRTITRNPAYADVPVIMCTSKNQETDRVWGMRQGAKDYFVKPVDPAQLLARIATLGA